jgi:predicted nucleic acid-binding protein
MSRPHLFMDSSALFAGVVSADGASRALLLLAEAELILLTVSEQVIAETEHAIARKVPRALSAYREALRSARLRIVRDPSPQQVESHREIIAHASDVPIVVAAVQARVDYLVTFNRRHFVDDPGVAARSGLCVGSPSSALAWVRERLAQGKE